MNKRDKIYISGHNGMVGSAILRKLQNEGFENLIYKNSRELDLRNQNSVELFFRKEKPKYVFLAAAKVGGILANNSYRAEFLYDNLMIEANVIHSSYLNGVEKLLFLGSSCIYPKDASQPINEDSLLSGYLEYTNQPYAIAKICGIEMCDSYRSQYNCNFISAMPTNLYGPNDNYDLNTSHVLPALMRKFIEAKRSNSSVVKIWGTGKPKREFLHVDDLAEACLFLMLNYNEKGIVNIGTGEDISIFELALLIKNIVGFNGNLEFDANKPDGTSRKLLNVNKIKNLGWNAKIELIEGLKLVFEQVRDFNFNR
jgi:GDP-L-fucose synthase